MSKLNFIDVIKKCENAQGAGTKKIIQAALQECNETAIRCIHAAMDPYRVYGVRKYDTPSKYADSTSKIGTASGDLAIESFLFLLNELSEKKLTGNAARDAVTKAIGNFTEDDAQYFARILDKDLKAGFSSDTFNKLYPDNKIPCFEVMLADKCDNPEDFEKEVTFPCQADFKYDGCLSSSWTIQLRDGRTVTIGEFVDNDMEGEVLSYNVTTKKKEWKKIVAKVKNSWPGRDYEWFRLTLEDGTVLPPLTGNHRIWLPEHQCWRRVDELIVNDIVFHLPST